KRASLRRRAAIGPWARGAARDYVVCRNIFRSARYDRSGFLALMRASGGAKADLQWEPAMFSKEFAHTLVQATNALQQDQSGSQLPIAKHLLNVLRGLSIEVQRLQVQVSVAPSSIVLQAGSGSIAINSSGSV